MTKSLAKNQLKQLRVGLEIFFKQKNRYKKKIKKVFLMRKKN